MTLALPTKWIWDSWYVRDGDLWHGFFLQADKSLGDPDLRHFNVTPGPRDQPATSRPGSTRAPASRRPKAPAWDDCTTWTGSVVQGDDGLWHLFYTGTTRAEDGLKQRIGHATSTDLHNWTRVGDGLALDIDDRYEEYAPRPLARPGHARPLGDAGSRGRRLADVLHRPRAGRRRAERRRRHRLRHLARPCHLDAAGPRSMPGGTFGQMEVPQVFEAGGRWYCLFCTDARALLQGLQRLLSRRARSAAPTTWSPTIRAGPGRWRRALPRRRSGGRPLRGADRRHRQRLGAARLPPQPGRRAVRRRDPRPGAGDHRRRRLAARRLKRRQRRKLTWRT